MQHVNLTNSLLALLALALGFFIGQLFMNVLPGLSWPYNVTAGYALGLLAGVFVSFELFKKWQAPAYTKLFTSIVLIAVVGSVSIHLQILDHQITVNNIIMREEQQN